jgi:hypothetical protein
MRVGAAVAKMRVALADLAAGSPSRRPIDPGRGEFFASVNPARSVGASKRIAHRR